MQSQQKYIYWEQQGIDQLCGLHTINSLLQGPFFNEIQLAQIGMDIDKREQQLMGTQAMQDGKSHNVANDGNFSIQVLQESLKSKGFTIESVDSSINRQEDMVKETGFICHSQSHWFAIRKVHGVWYNMNSCSVYGPSSIGDFYLSAFLQNVKQNGFTIFVVRGNYPTTQPKQFSNLQKFQRFLTLEVQKKYEDYEKKINKNSMNIGAYEANNMDKAIEESKTLQDLVQNQEMPDISKISQDLAKNQTFKGKVVSLESNMSKDAVDYENFLSLAASNDDPELSSAIQQSLKASLADKFKQKPADGITIRFLYPCGAKAMWTFTENDFVEDMYDFAFYSIPEKDGAYKFYLQQTHPTVKYSNLKQTIVEADIDDMTSIHVNKM